MTQRNLGCVSDDVTTSAQRPAPRRTKPARNPQTLGECETGRVVTIRVVVTGPGADGWRFVRPLNQDGTEGEPLHLPGWWPIAEGVE